MPFSILFFGFFLNADIATDAEQLSSSVYYTSVFDRYQNWEPETVGDWRLANDTVGDIGGWQYYSLEPSLKKQSDAFDPSKSDASRGLVK